MKASDPPLRRLRSRLMKLGIIVQHARERFELSFELSHSEVLEWEALRFEEVELAEESRDWQVPF